MAFEATVYEVLIASPSDCDQYREAAQLELAAWNREHGRASNVLFLPRLWELDAVPAMGADAQGVINQQLLARADAVLAMFWHRFGTPTREFAAGTVEEITRAHRANKAVWAYFCEQPLPFRHDATQLARVMAFRDTFSGLYRTFSDVHHLRRSIGQALTHFVNKEPADRSPAAAQAGEPERTTSVPAGDDPVGAMLYRFSAHDPSSPAREVYEGLRKLGYEVFPPRGQATYLRFVYPGPRGPVRLYLNSAVLASSANGDRDFVSGLDGATVRPGEVVFPLSDGAKRALAAAAALKARADRG